MKRIITIAALLLTFIAASAQDGRSIYRKYSDAENVSAVYISPAMFRLIGKLPNLTVGDKDTDIAPIIQTLSGLYIIDSNNPEVNEALRKDTEKYTDSSRYELLMEAKEDGELTSIYTAGSETVVESFVMITNSGSEMTFICIDGRMNRDDLETLFAEEMM